MSRVDISLSGTMASQLRVTLVSTYDLGHQPFGLSSPAAWLRAEGAQVSCCDLAVQQLDEDVLRVADLVAIYVPMHTATRMAAEILPRMRGLNPSGHICVYGLYAPVNADYLLSLGADSVVGGEFEEPLRDLARRLSEHKVGHEAESAKLDVAQVSLGRQRFLIPDRTSLPLLTAYASLRMPDGTLKTVGYTEATRGCKHLCRHCPIVPVYGGHFRVVQHDVVLADIAQQVDGGAEHITFGDPDFFNGPAHALAVVRALHERFPLISYDVTIKIEHLVKLRHHLPVLRDTGCILVTSAVEAFEESILEYFDKQHTRHDFEDALNELRANGIALNPTFVAFTPWTSLEIYTDFLSTIQRHRLVGNVAPVQYAIRLLIPEGSRLLSLPGVHDFLHGFDPEALCYRWAHPDQKIDDLAGRLIDVIARAVANDLPRAEIFRLVCAETAVFAGAPAGQRLAALAGLADEEAAAIPYLTEPWYCCAEPVDHRVAPPV